MSSHQVHLRPSIGRARTSIYGTVWGPSVPERAQGNPGIDPRDLFLHKVLAQDLPSDGLNALLVQHVFGGDEAVVVNQKWFLQYG
jgi:hypothetical protein